MNFLDWLSLATMLGGLVGMQVTADPNVELNRTTQGQMVMASSTNAEVTVGGRVVMRFTDSGVNTGLERAVEAKENLKLVISYHELPAHYVGLGLRLGGDNELTTLNYLDMRITQVTMTDAKANGMANAHDLAERWKAEVDDQIHHLPSPLPNDWIASTGKPTSSLLVSDPTLAQSVADCLPGSAGQHVSVSVQAGTVVLEGQVADDSERGRLNRMVRQVPGVTNVVDHTSTLR